MSVSVLASGELTLPSRTTQPWSPSRIWVIVLCFLSAVHWTTFLNLLGSWMSVSAVNGISSLPRKMVPRALTRSARSLESFSAPPWAWMALSRMARASAWAGARPAGASSRPAAGAGNSSRRMVTSEDVRVQGIVPTGRGTTAPVAGVIIAGPRERPCGSILGQFLARRVVARHADGELAGSAGARLHVGGRAADPPALGAPLPVAATPQPVDLRLLRVAVNHPHLRHAQVGVEGQLVVRLVAGAVDLDDRRRGALKVFPAIDGEALRREQDEVRDTEVVGPATRGRQVNLVAHPG